MHVGKAPGVLALVISQRITDPPGPATVAWRMTPGSWERPSVRHWRLGDEPMTLAAVLPLAFVMIAGPQIISSFFLATSSEAVKSSLSYLAGATLAHDGGHFGPRDRTRRVR